MALVDATPPVPPAMEASASPAAPTNTWTPKATSAELATRPAPPVLEDPVQTACPANPSTSWLQTLLASLAC